MGKALLNPHPTRNRRAGLAGALLLVLLGAPACAQGPEKSGTASQSSTPAGESLDSLQARASRNRIKGAESAPLTIVEISDFQCPFCRRFAEEAYRQIDSAYIRPGKAKLLFINYPMPNHTEAWAASEAALCAAAQGSFWPMHDRLFATQGEWSGKGNPAERFAGYARELRLDAAAYRRCVEEDQMAALIVNDVMQASGAGIQGTPTFILNGQRAISGAQPFEEFRKAIDELLAGAPAVPAPQATPAPPATQTPPRR